MLYNYIKTAFRHLWKNRLYSVINILGLAVALTCVVLSILYYKYEHNFDSFHKNGSQIFRITTTYTDNKTAEIQRGAGTAQVQGPAFKAQVPEILDYVRIYGGDVMENVRSSDKAFTLGAGFADSAFFKVFSFPLLFGNPNTALSEKYSVVITEKTALKFFGTSNVIGKRLDIEDNPDSLFASFIITGVAKNPPANSSIQFDILIPFSYLQIMWDDKTWLNNYLPTFVVLHPEADLKAIQQKFLAIHNVHAKEQLEQGRKTGEFDKKTFYSLQSLTDIHLSPEGGFANASKPAYSLFLLGISVFILLMASINFINLSIAGSLKRAKEIGVRKISGSSKMQIIWQFLIESSIICFTALCMAIVLAQSLLPFFNQLAGGQIIFSTLLDWKLFVYFIGLLIVNILLSGLYPSYVLTRFQPKEVLYNKPALSGRNWLGKSLVVLQFSIATCLIIGSIIYYKQMDFVRTKDLGYNPHNIVRVDVPFKRDMKLVYPLIKNELAEEPGIKQMSLETHNDGSKIYIGDNVIKATYKLVEKSYISMLEIPVKQGRNFSDLYRTDQTNAAVVNEAFVKAAGLKDPIGTQVQIKDWFPREALIIIGVVNDYHRGSLKEIIQPEILCINDGSQGTVLVKVDKLRQKQALVALEKAYNTAVPGSEYNYTFWDELNAREYHKENKWKQIVNAATVLSILICCLGLFGLTHLATQMRVKEIGIRKTLGASVSNIVSLITKDFVKLIVIAVVIASPVAWFFMNKWLQDFAYRINIGWWMFALAGIIAIVIAMITVGFQAVKSAIANPVKSLRTE
ncbi:ABC transporter permease [Terrimonas pollutisoli]|uniref:ABC transporter permease n=1 Tax=Terrimonas pollutisoli TaxID=3034147 RepID=UPI0023ED4251|nr:ABC transporter permease [Terrimonas sp. H1YJ31]